MTVRQITNKPDLDAVVANAGTMVIYVSNDVAPSCQSFTPKFEELAARIDGISFYQMELTIDTSSLFKFAPSQLPVLVLMHSDSWCKTLMGADMSALEAGVQELRQAAARDTSRSLLDDQEGHSSTVVL